VQVDVLGLSCKNSRNEPDASDSDPAKGKQEGTTKEERMAALKEKRDRRVREEQRERILDEEVAKADKPPSRRDELTDKEREFLDEDPRNPRLAIDPEGDGSYKVGEAQTALEAEKAGQVTPPVRRALGKVDPSESGADIVDGDGKKWDVKSGSDKERIVKSANENAGSEKENVMVDCAGMDDAAVSSLQNDVNQQLDPDAGDVIYVRR
jgi:hypothetical protein